MAKLDGLAKPLDQFSLETVQMFHRDATAAGFAIDIREGEEVNAAAFKKLVLEAIALSLSKVKKRGKAGLLHGQQRIFERAGSPAGVCRLDLNS